MRFASLFRALALAILSSTPLAAALAQTRPDSTKRDSVVRLEAVTVSAIRGGSRNEAPISSKTLDAPEIERRNFGQDIPLLLQGAPSVTSYSETGNYWGYSYLRLRGIDQSRINLSLDGIPLNDPEDQVLYFADFPDLANSLSSIQVQRGVGTSAPGTASYGGSVNFQTLPLTTTPRQAELQLQGGAFSSGRASLEYASGVMDGGFAVAARASALRSEGYRRHSGMEGRSAFLSAGHVGARHVLKLTALAGLFADTLAYVGATRAELTADRRSNLLRPDETDRFGEQVAALSYTRYLASSSVSATAYRLSASGNYDVCIAACDQPQGTLWNFNLDFVWYGGTAVWSFDQGPARVSIGVNANTYERDHHAYDRSAPATALYFNTGHKDDASAFTKVSVERGALTLFGDLQGRRAHFGYTPDASAGIGPTSIDWDFVNPKVGATWRWRPALSTYASYGINSREPARSDMFAGFDNIDTTNAAFVGPLSRVRPERAHDLEAGVRYRAGRWSLDANAFAMEFRNEILPVGQLSYIGTPLRTNVRASRRHGLETDLTARPVTTVEFGISATAMRARITEFVDDASGTTYRDVEPLLTPTVVSSQRVTVTAMPALSLTAMGQYSGRSQLSNTGDPSLRLPATYVVNLIGEWKPTRGSVGATLHVNNATNHRGFASGHVSFGEARYYVLPPLNAFLLVTLSGR
jgi:iron complex outermembrane recepter protein